jgi:hypothetical protein
MTVTASLLSDAPGRERPAQPARSPRADLERLAALCEEASETSRLANLLGRAPYAAAALACGAVVAAIGSGSTSPARSLAWLVLIIAAIAALARCYRQTLRAPFERGPLQAFAQDLDAILLYAGFAWGAGAFLVLNGATPLALSLFSAGSAGLVAVILRTAKPVLFFFAPVAGLTLLSAAARPHPGSAVLAVAVIALSAAMTAASLVLERRSKPRPPWLSDLPVG